ncbi:MAG: CDP-alcohol phosphatidyltransferase family protein [Bacteroidota bacterium]
MIKKNIPNAITCGNLICGCLAIVCAFNGNLVWSGYLVLIASVLDFFDGFFARLLKVISPIGKELDSLADVVTFGVVPGVVMFHMIKQGFSYQSTISQSHGFIPSSYDLNYSQQEIYGYIGFVITLFSAIRLAKFNVDTHQSDSFIGLPTPANAIFICSLPLVIDQLTPEIDMSLAITAAFSFVSQSVPTEFLPLIILQNPYFLMGVTILMSYLLISNITLFALKFKNYSWRDNKIRYLFLIFSLILLIVFQFIAFPFIIVLYIIMSVINNIVSRKIPNA